MPAPVRFALFDFGDTLVREPFCVVPPDGVPDWERLVLETYEADGLCDRWCAGEVGFDGVVSRVAERCAISVDITRAAMLHDWRNLRQNQSVLRFARELGSVGRAAIVTVNPDIFTDVIAPHLALDSDFPVIVTSWEEREMDKTALCEIALERLGAPGAVESALLIDNREDNVRDFRARGGHGYLFVDDGTFEQDGPRLEELLGLPSQS